MYLSCDTKKFHDNESTHTYYIIFGRPPIGGKLPPFPPGGATDDATVTAMLCRCRTTVHGSHGLRHLASGPRDVGTSLRPRTIPRRQRRTISRGGSTRPRPAAPQAAVDAVQMERTAFHRLSVDLHPGSLLLGTLRHQQTSSSYVYFPRWRPRGLSPAPKPFIVDNILP